MRCFRSSSKSGDVESKHRFSWGFISKRFSSESKSAPISTALQANAEQQLPSSPSHAQQQAPAIMSHERQCSEGEATSLDQGKSERALELQVFTYAELRAIARNFSRSSLVGEGGFGCVYKGTLKGNNPSDPQSSKEVAVKLLNRNGMQGHKEWLAEVRFLGLVDHPNLVKLVGYCAEDDERGIQRLLVYEFMARGSLEDYLFRRDYPVLTWQQRLQIILGAAQGLAYLHEGINGIQVIFRDFKTSNILLAEDWSPKLSDFGLAREGPEMGATHVSTSVVGTIGYAAPEYVQTGRLTVKSDVWSFGVVLFEMLTGRRSMDRNRPKSEQHLLEWVRPYLHGSKKVHAIMDPSLDGDYSLIQAQHIVDLALHCSHRAPKARPSMSVVVGRLRHILQGDESHNSARLPPVSRVKPKRAYKSEKHKEPAKQREISPEDVKKRGWASEPIRA